METETKTRIPAELRALLRRRCVFLAWTLAVFVFFGVTTHALGIDQPYTEHPLYSPVAPYTGTGQ